jgi:uncharacterized membrane protein
MSTLAPWVVLVVGIIVLLISIVSGQSSGFRAMQLVGILVGAAALVAGLRWRRRLRTVPGSTV